MQVTNRQYTSSKCCTAPTARRRIAAAEEVAGAVHHGHDAFGYRRRCLALECDDESGVSGSPGGAARRAPERARIPTVFPPPLSKFADRVRGKAVEKNATRIVQANCLAARQAKLG